MKRLIILVACVVFALSLVSCTENDKVKNFGGNMKVELPKGKKLIFVTWKEDDLWYLVEDMEEGYVPKTKEFIENSSFGMLNGKVTFTERK